MAEEHSRQVHAYWTPERMAAAVPEPMPDRKPSPDPNDSSDQANFSNSRAIHAYWTPERMAAAQPEPMPDREPTPDRDDHACAMAQLQVAGSLKIVPDDNVKKFPYQSVGKLYYTKVNSSGVKRDSSATAWVANSSSSLHVVFTAAHCLKYGDEKATNIQFIPGYIPPNTEIFGKYAQIPGGEGVAWAVDPNWDPNKLQAEYDRGVVHLDKDPNTGKYVDEVVIPIQILANQKYDSKSEWNTIGYPIASSGNPSGKMCERSGTFYKMSSSGGSFYKYGVLPGGTSGGPWIMAGSNDSSNGIQAGNVSQYGCAQSTYFKSTTDELVKLFFSV